MISPWNTYKNIKNVPWCHVWLLQDVHIFTPKYIMCLVSKPKIIKTWTLGFPWPLEYLPKLGKMSSFTTPKPSQTDVYIVCIGLILSQLEQIAIVSDIPTPFGDVSNLICFFLNYYLGTNIYLPSIWCSPKVQGFDPTFHPQLAVKPAGNADDDVHRRVHYARCCLDVSWCSKSCFGPVNGEEFVWDWNCTSQSK